MSRNHPWSACFGPWRVKRSQQRLDCIFGKRTLPIGSKGRHCDRRGGLASAFKPRLRLRQGPPSGMVLLMVADAVRLPHVTHAGLAVRDATCRLPLRGVVSPQNVELWASTQGCTKRSMVQNAFSLVHKSLHTTCPKITHGVFILATGGARGHSNDWTVQLENGPSPSALRGAIATSFKPRLMLRQGPPSKMVLLMVRVKCRPAPTRH